MQALPYGPGSSGLRLRSGPASAGLLRTLHIPNAGGDWKAWNV